MLHRICRCCLMAVLLAVTGAVTAPAQSSQRDYDDTYANTAKIDRYLDAEIWTDHSDGEYYEGDNIVIHYRVNRDAFVAIYSIDTRGRVNLLFPTDPTEDNFVYGGITYSLPSGHDDYDLIVTGPEGIEHLQIIASRERFPVPNWYHNSGLVCDWDDRDEYLDYLNSRYFVRYGGQRFAYDRAVVFINEWEPYYYHPIYYPVYPSWAVCGNVYIDYPYGATIYVNGIYWGCAPLYIPRLLVGWHTITVYDWYGYCWESDFHVSRYNTVIFDRAVIKLNSTTRSKYASIRGVGYKDPVKSGYSNFKAKAVKSGEKSISPAGIAGAKSAQGKSGSLKSDKATSVPAKKYARGSSKLVKTTRGYETAGVPSDFAGKVKKSESVQYKSKAGAAAAKSIGSSRSAGSTGKEYDRSGTGSKSAGSSDYYQKKSGSSGRTLSGSSKAAKQGGSAAGSKSGTVKQPGSTSKSGKATKSGTYKRSGADKSQGGKSIKSGTSKGSGGSSKSSGSIKSSGGKASGGYKSSGGSKSAGSSKASPPKSTGSAKSGGQAAPKSKGGK